MSSAEGVCSAVGRTLAVVPNAVVQGTLRHDVRGGSEIPDLTTGRGAVGVGPRARPAGKKREPVLAWMTGGPRLGRGPLVVVRSQD